MDVQVAMWVLGIVVTILMAIVGAVTKALWTLNQSLNDIRLHIADKYPKTETVKETIDNALEPIAEQLGRLERAVYSRRGTRNDEPRR